MVVVQGAVRAAEHRVVALVVWIVKVNVFAWNDVEFFVHLKTVLLATDGFRLGGTFAFSPKLFELHHEELVVSFFYFLVITRVVVAKTWKAFIKPFKSFLGVLQSLLVSVQFLIQ